MGHYYDVIHKTQQAAKAVERERKMAGKQKNPAGKMRKLEQPYAQWTDPATGWEYKLLKSWQADNSKEYARWFVAVRSEYTHGSFELGDEYVQGLRRGLLRAMNAGAVSVDQSIWSVDERGYSGSFAAWVWGER